ncbi:MAG TPA: CocE/NonD family hydrolase [Mycobacteriales bacterium]|nr:CocE/NonD family hydrolase [Mycobacteriales bacterium]
MAEGSCEHQWIPTRNGARLAATVYRPAGPEPAAAILEALPYRKDDLTAGYGPEYRRLRDEYGYAVVRVDVRGTGSSEGVASDEYPPEEIGDLCDVIAWIAEQPWCSGSVGMYGTSYSGFNSLHLAAARPPALKAIVAIYASDDRYTDDVHYMGGLVKLLDLVDYPIYMVAMNALPPLPGLAGDDWRAAWKQRVEATEPWLLRWLEEQHDGEFWRRGSIRPAYDRIGCPTMLVGGWADGYRNNTFRTIRALANAGVPHRLLMGPWAHAATSTSLPGPRIDLVPEMVRWWDRWLRDEPNGVDDEPPITVFARRSSPPLPDLDEVAGEWRNEPGWPLDRVTDDERSLGDGIVEYVVVPDVGTAAWISCAGHLPWGQASDQRYDDAASLTWEWPGDDLEILGHAVLKTRVASSAPVATLAVRLCDVFPDGRSTLITRGTLNLTHRHSRETPEPLPLNEFVDVELELEATSWTFDPGHRLRLAIAGTDWPNTVAPPEPLTLTLDLDATSLVLPRVVGPSPSPLPSLTPSDATPSESTDVVWRVERDVLRRETSCVVDHGSTYDEDGVTCTDHYVGRVTVNTETSAQRAEATSSFTLAWPDVTVRSEARMTMLVSDNAFDVSLELDCHDGDTVIAQRRWSRQIPRDLG